MKNTTLKATILCAALTGFGASVHAQDVKFEYNSDFLASCWQVHRAVPLWADFNNDGKMDIYYGGTSCANGWQCRGILIKNLGDSQFEMIDDVITETVQEEVTDEEGNVTIVEKEKVIGMKNGLPYTAYGNGSLAFDYNQDGLVDFLFLNRGGNNTNTKKGMVLVKNLGDFQFEVVDDTLSRYNCGNDETSFNEENEWGCVAVADYDKDGYPDVLVEGIGEGRFVKLFHNVKGEKFEIVNVFDPLPFDVEPNKVGIYKMTDPSLDEDGIEIPGEYYDEPTYEAKPLSHGSVVFADFDNDGWPDIVCTGYADGYEGTEIMPGGDEIRLYRNTRDGRFQDVTDKLCADGESVTDIFNKWGSEDCCLTGVDYNQDGKVDLMFIGTVAGHNGKQAMLLMNVSDGTNIAFEEVTTPVMPISGAPARVSYCADVNGDSYVDFIYRGWTDYNGINDWRYAISLSDGSGANYSILDFTDNEPSSVGGYFSENMTFGDFNGDNLIDGFGSNWGANGDMVFYSENKTDAVVSLPETPQNVSASEVDGKLVVTWDAVYMDNGNEAMYNVYVKNTETGATRMLVAANPTTGYQLAYMPFSSYLLSGGENPSYTFENLESGNYEVGVQAVTYSYAASEFATATSDLTTGIKNTTADNEVTISVIVNDGSIVVKSANEAPVSVYDANGRTVAAGMTNSAIPFTGKGVYMVSSQNQTVKMVK